MTTNAQLQFVDGPDVNRNWQIPDAETLKIRDDSTFRFAAIAIAFGLVFGVAAAATFGNQPGTLPSPSVASSDSNAAVLTTPAVYHATHASTVSSRTEQKTNTNSSTAVLPVTLKTSNSHKTVSSHHRRAAHKAAVTNHSNSLASNAPAAAPKAPVVAAFVPVREPLRVIEPPVGLFFMEGDATVADFDAQMGRIETDEGKTFLIEKTASDGIAAPWQDYHSNVHYRCDQTGNCTIRGAGVTLPNVKMST
jgi:hypothetical protein